MKTIPTISVDSLTLGKRFCKLAVEEEMTYEAINALLPGRDVQNGDRYILQTALKYALRESGIVIEVMHGKGVKRLNDSEIASLSDSAIPKIRKVASRIIRKVTCADYEKLNGDDKTKYNAGLSVLGVIQQFTSQKACDTISKGVAAVSNRLSFEQTVESTKKLFSK